MSWIFSDSPPPFPTPWRWSLSLVWTCFKLLHLGTKRTNWRLRLSFTLDELRNLWHWLNAILLSRNEHQSKSKNLTQLKRRKQCLSTASFIFFRNESVSWPQSLFFLSQLHWGNILITLLTGFRGDRPAVEFDYPEIMYKLIPNLVDSISVTNPLFFSFFFLENFH